MSLLHFYLALFPLFRSPSAALLLPCETHHLRCPFSDNSHINSRQIEIKTGSIEMQFSRMHTTRGGGNPRSFTGRGSQSRARARFSPRGQLPTLHLFPIIRTVVIAESSVPLAFLSRAAAVSALRRRLSCARYYFANLYTRRNLSRRFAARCFRNGASKRRLLLLHIY